MRVFLFCLGLGASAGCARDEITLGTDGTNTGGGNNTGANAAGAEEDAGTGGDNSNNSGNTAGGNSNNSGGEPDAGGSTGGECTPAMCAAPMDGGEIESDVNGAPVMIQGMGHAFVKVRAIDGQSMSNAAGGIRATLTSGGGNYDLFAYGGPSDACADLDISSTNGAGEPDSVAPIWGVNGPFLSVDWDLSFEVRPVDGMCGEPWSLTLQGNPCQMFSNNIPKQCP